MSRHNFDKQFLTFLSFLPPPRSFFLFLILLLSHSWARGRLGEATSSPTASCPHAEQCGWGGASLALSGALLSLIPRHAFFPSGIETEQLWHQVKLLQDALLPTTLHPLQASLGRGRGEGKGDPRDPGRTLASFILLSLPYPR